MEPLGESFVENVSKLEARYRIVREIIETIVLTLLLFFIIRLAIQNFSIDGHSMEPSLHNNELILVDKWPYLFQSPARGDVIVFVAPPNPTQDYIKRVIGLPGDVISIHGDTVIVDGTTLDETYIDPQNQGNPYSSFSNRVVPPNAYFVLGDNRAGSSDSRDWGCVPRQNIIGRAAIVYWPLSESNDGFLPNVASVFTHVQNAPLASTQASTTNESICTIISQPTASSTQLAPLHPRPPLEPPAVPLLLLILPLYAFKQPTPQTRPGLYQQHIHLMIF